VHGNTPDEQRAAALRIERAIVELRRGRGVNVLDKDAVTTVIAVERLGADALAETGGDGQRLELLVTAERAGALGLVGYPTGTRIRLSHDTAGHKLLALAGMAAHGNSGRPLPGQVSPGDPRTAAALSLARHAQLIPALLVRADEVFAAGLEPLTSPATLRRAPAGCSV